MEKDNEEGFIQAAQFAQSIKRGNMGEKGYRAFYQTLGRAKKGNDARVKAIKEITHITQGFADEWKNNYSPRDGQEVVKKRVTLSMENYSKLQSLMSNLKLKTISSLLNMLVKDDVKIVHGAGE